MKEIQGGYLLPSFIICVGLTIIWAVLSKTDPDFAVDIGSAIAITIISYLAGFLCGKVAGESSVLGNVYLMEQTIRIHEKAEKKLAEVENS